MVGALTLYFPLYDLKVQVVTKDVVVNINVIINSQLSIKLHYFVELGVL